MHRQLSLLLPQDLPRIEVSRPAEIQERLADLLAGDLDFRGAETGYASHQFHSFVAKFPPQLPRLFIQNLTRVGETVLDPMAGSGTTIVEAVLLGRRGIGVDLDPLAIQIGRAKTTGVLWADLARAAQGAITRAHRWLQTDRSAKLQEFRAYLDNATRKFLDYWFLPPTQEELAALIAAIQEEPDPDLRRLLLIAFSSTIVTKSGGVSLARDLAHSRPHRDPDKRPANAMDLFWERIGRYRRALISDQPFPSDTDALILHGDARALPLEDQSVHLIVTSPPYANAIDYMRAHKFSLVWMGKRMGELSRWRSRYIGAERAQENGYINLRTEYHRQICKTVLGLRDGVPNNADRASKVSRDIAERIVQFLPYPLRTPPPSEQTVGTLFEKATAAFLQESFRLLAHIRPGLNLIRNRKGHTPHIVAVTAEPMPTRIAALALGTGDVDCVYHFALPELIRQLKNPETKARKTCWIC